MGARQALLDDPIFNGKGGKVILRYSFKNAASNPGSVSLVVEDMSRAAGLSVNGTQINISNLGWHFDHPFGKVDISHALKNGINTVEVELDYDFLTEIEQAYIVGDFGVCIPNPFEAEIVDKPENISMGSWIGQGYPFYSGSITYKTTLDLPCVEGRSFIKLNRPSGTLFKIRANGIDIGNILWQPNELELTDHLRVGTNLLEITVVSSRQNTLGPLHERQGDDDIGCGPGHFEYEGAVRPEWSFYDYGLLGGAEIIRRM